MHNRTSKEHKNKQKEIFSKMEDNVRATYICYNCDHQYVKFNMYEGEPAECPECKTLNYPGYEVSKILNLFFDENVLRCIIIKEHYSCQTFCHKFNSANIEGFNLKRRENFVGNFQ